ncbi:MAG TPA: universal stress protein [Anaerolineales bacterium]|nr:universal stress protein [Anaerolineales bacterium]
MSELLIATNGYKETWHAIEYGAQLAESMRMKITLLGLTEKLNPAAIDDHHPLEEIFESAVSLFKDRGVEYSLEVQNGEAEQVIPKKANNGDYIVVISPLGRPQLKRWLTGRSLRFLMEKITSPILYVPESRLPLKRVLACIGGLGYAESTEELACQIASANNAEITILHVIPPTDLDYPTTKNVRDHADDLVETDTPQGRNLKKGLGIANKYELSANAVVRKGNIVEQILAEAKAGDYDLICMGSPYSAHTLRQLYTSNVTAEVAEALHCPVLTARYRSP